MPTTSKISIRLLEEQYGTHIAHRADGDPILGGVRARLLVFAGAKGYLRIESGVSCSKGGEMDSRHRPLWP